MENLEKVVIVTGAAKGIGRGIAHTFAKDGYNVVVSDIDHEECLKVVSEIEGMEKKAIAISCDVSVKSEVDAMIAATIEKFGRIDVLVNNAGIFPFQPFTEMSEADWDKVIDVNLKSIFLCTQASLKHMKEGSKIVNISSIAGAIGFSGLTHYCGSKAGLDGMIRALAIELAEKKINVNNVAPGAIETPGATGALDEETKKQYIATIPAGRMGTPEDIAAATLFLASDGADYITGQTLIVDGGFVLR